jgi:predicted transcriptional regulator
MTSLLINKCVSISGGSSTMAQSVLEMAKELVIAQLAVRRLSPEDIQKALHKTYASLMALKQQEDTGSSSSVSERGLMPTPVDWKHSIRWHTTTCLECGVLREQLSIRHLRTHGLDLSSYRAKYGIPRTQPLAAKDLAAQRKHIFQRIKPWEKSPRNVQAHKGKVEDQAVVTPRRATRRQESKKGPRSLT